MTYYKVHLTGTATGPVGAEVKGTNQQCQEWTDCQRREGQPATTHWTEESSAESTSEYAYEGNGDIEDGINIYVHKYPNGPPDVDLTKMHQKVCD